VLVRVQKHGALAAGGGGGGGGGVARGAHKQQVCRHVGEVRAQVRGEGRGDGVLRHDLQARSQAHDDLHNRHVLELGGEGLAECEVDEQVALVAHRANDGGDVHQLASLEGRERLLRQVAGAVCTE